MAYNETPTQKDSAMKSWTEICQANVDHYNNNQTTHVTVTVLGAMLVTAAIPVMAERLARTMHKIP